MILYFGCWGAEAGHYMRAPDGRTPRRWEQFVPWGTHIDGGLAPRTASGAQAPQWVAGFHQAVSWVGAPGEVVWSALAWWDNSVDRRPGSNAVFLADRRCTPAELLAEARAAFPQVFARFGYEVVLPPTTKEGA